MGRGERGGTGAGIRMAGFDIAGKTGTAQVVGLGKDIGKNKDHSWFVSYAPAYKPEIALVALIENSGFGGHHAAPAVRRIYDVYYRKTRNEEPPGALPVAKTPEARGKPEPKIARNEKVASSVGVVVTKYRSANQYHVQTAADDWTFNCDFGLCL